MRPVDRRTFLRDAAVASAATAAATVVPTPMLPAQALLPRSARLPERWQRTPCRLCGVGCGLLVNVERGRAAAVKGDLDSPVSRGSACAKGYYSVQALYGADRITRAMVRRGGTLVEAPLAEALDLLARRLRDTVHRHGKDSVAVYGSAQWTLPDAYVATKLLKGCLGSNNIETSARLSGASAMAGLESSFGLDGVVGCYEDVDHADVFVLWDDNLAETDPVLFSRMLDRRRASPAVRIIHLSTRTTRTSYAADRTVLHTPHAGPAIANAVCQEIVARGLVNRAFVDRYVSFRRGSTESRDLSTGEVPAPEEAIEADWNRYVRFLAPYTPQWAEELAGVPAETIRWLASVYGDPMRKVMSVWGSDLDQNARGTWLNSLIYNIHLLVGKVASPGNSPFCTTGQPGGGNAVQNAGALTHALPRGTVWNREDRRRAAEIWGVPEARIDPRPGRTALDMFRALERGDIRFLWIQATNPMRSLPNLDRYRQAAGGQESFVVVSEVYPTATTDVADVVLPAALWIEREGIFGNAERRLQHFEALLAPPGDAKSDAWLMIEVARRLGFSSCFPWTEADHVERIWDEYRRFHPDPRSALPPIADLRASPGLLWPYVDGRETRWRYNTAYDPAADRSRGEFDFYGHPDHRAWVWLWPYRAPAESPDATYPFWLATGAVLEHFGTGTLTQRIPTLHRAVPHAYVELNREDAARLGIRNHDLVRLTSRRGSLELEARLDYRSQLPRGQLFVPSFDEAVPINRLTLDSVDHWSGQPDAGQCAVQVERVPGKRKA